MKVSLHALASFRPHARGVEVGFGENSGRVVCVINDELVAWLLSFRAPMSVTKAVRSAVKSLGISVAEANELVDAFVANRVLLAGGDDARRARGAAWGTWGDVFRFQEASRDTPFESTAEAAENHREMLAERAAALAAGLEAPQPGPYRPDHPRLEGARVRRLARTRAHIDSSSFADVVCSSRGVSGSGSLRFAQLSEILEHTAGKLREVEDLDGWGPHIFRTSPSCSSRHPIELYVVARCVNGLQPGIYHYRVRDHALQPLSYSCETSLLFNDTERSDEACLFLYTMRWDRYMWKYRATRFYQWVMFEVGHLAASQTWVAESMGVRSEFFLDFDEAAAQALIGGTDNLEEAVMCVAALSSR